MQNKKSGCLPTVGIFFLIVIILPSIIGSRRRSSDNGSVTIDSNNQFETQASVPVESEQATESPFAYEITDTSFNYYTNSLGRVEFFGIVEVTNTGTCNIYMKDCKFDIEDNDGHLLQSESIISTCPDIIAPGEKGYFYNNIGSTYIDKEVSVDNGIKLVPNYKLEEAKGEIVDYPVTDTELRKDDYGNAKVTGRVTNNTEEDQRLVYVQIIFKDASGKVLSIFGTNVTELDAGSTVSFDTSAIFSDSSVTVENIASYEIIARKHHYQF